jgi:hypothetical protein
VPLEEHRADIAEAVAVDVTERDLGARDSR